MQGAPLGDPVRPYLLAWTESPRRSLPRPWFAGGLKNLKAILLAESPVAFRRRNLFVSANTLSRA